MDDAAFYTLSVTARRKSDRKKFGCMQFLSSEVLNLDADPPKFDPAFLPYLETNINRELEKYAQGPFEITKVAIAETQNAERELTDEDFYPGNQWAENGFKIGDTITEPFYPFGSVELDKNILAKAQDIV